jgi:opacity protein-like surface antigen
MKKTMMAAVVASALLATAGANAAGFNGPYVGFDAGYTTLKSDGLASTFGSELEGSNVNFGVQLGYGAVVSGSFYLGGEIGLRNNVGDFGDKTVTGTVGSATLSAKTSTAKMFSLIPGFVVTPNTLVYGRLGRGNTDNEISASNTLGQSASTTNNADFNVYGLGVDYLMTKNLSVKAEANSISADDASGTSFNVGVNYRF